MVAAQAGGDFIRQHGNAGHDFVLGDQIPLEGHAPADRLDFRRVAPLPHPFRVQAVGVLPQRFPAFSQQRLDTRFGLRGQVADGTDAFFRQRVHGGFPGEQQVGNRQGPEDFLEVIFRDHCGRVGLFIVGAHLGEHLVEGNAHGDGDADFPAHPLPDGIRQFPGREMIKLRRARHVQIGFVDGRGLHKIRIIPIDGVHPVGYFFVVMMPGRDEHDARAFLFCLPHRIGGFYAGFFRQLVLRHHHAQAVFRVARHRHGHIPEFRPLQYFAGRKKVVAIAMEDQAGLFLHGSQLLCYFCFYYTEKAGAYQ